MTLRYHFETGRGGSQSGQSNNRDSEGRLDYRHARGPITIGWGGLGEGLGQGPTMRSGCSWARAPMEVILLAILCTANTPYCTKYRRALQQPGCDASLPLNLRSPSGRPLMCYAGLWDLWLQKLPPIFFARADSPRLNSTQHNTTQHNTTQQCITTKQYKERGCRTETETSIFA
jgi:hypothetical protein